MLKRDHAMLNRVSLIQCQVCGSRDGLARHHIWNRSLGACDEPENIAVLCADCHRAVHEKAIDLGIYLTASQAAKCVLLAGTLYRAYRHLYPSENRSTSGIGWPE